MHVLGTVPWHLYLTSSPPLPRRAVFCKVWKAESISVAPSAMLRWATSPLLLTSRIDRSIRPLGCRFPFSVGARAVPGCPQKSNHDDESTSRRTRAGDGTTTSTLLTQEIVNQGMRLVTSGANPVELRQGILAASGMIIEEIKKLAAPVGKNEVRKLRVWRRWRAQGCRRFRRFVCVCVGASVCTKHFMSKDDVRRRTSGKSQSFRRWATFFACQGADRSAVGMCVPDLCRAEP
ncbi:MAG: TCP-1/cpn60 chaperonin family protein [Cyanobacteria bacterium P01_A01_bin.137]